MVLEDVGGRETHELAILQSNKSGVAGSALPVSTSQDVDASQAEGMTSILSCCRILRQFFCLFSSMNRAWEGQRPRHIHRPIQTWRCK